MKDTGSVGSKEEQDTSVDNTCYMKLASTSWLYTTLSSLQVDYLTICHVYQPVLLQISTFKMILYINTV